MRGWHVAGDKAYSIVENGLVIQFRTPSAFYSEPIQVSIQAEADAEIKWGLAHNQLVAGWATPPYNEL